MAHRPSDRTLRRWLATGRPKRVERHLNDPDAVARLEALTALKEGETALLSEHVRPGEEFEERVIAGLRQRLDNHGVGTTVSDLLGLGFHVAAALGRRPHPTPAPRDGDEGPGT